jgi:hypothetical protein
VKEAVSLRMKEQQPQDYKARELRLDILNIPSHVFGQHKRCKERGRKCEENRETEQNYVPLLKLHDLYKKVEDAMKYLSVHADSLLLNVTNNRAEGFHSNVCKVIGGKRVFCGARGSYNARIAGSVLQYNTQQVLTEVYKGMDKAVPSIVENMEKQRQIKVARTRESRQINGRKRKFIRESRTDRFYGPKSEKPDIPEDVLEQFRQKHLEKLSEDGKNWMQIERDTIKQSESELCG